jgi:type IV pilus assembly protein PilW
MTMRRKGAHQHGAGLVETMVGILIGMIVVLVIYNVFALTEAYKRTAVGAADAQTTGLYAQFVLSREIASAGNGILDSGIASVVRDLLQCANNEPKWSYPAPFDTLIPVPRMRPVPVLIHDGGGPTVSDSIIVTYSTAPHVVSPVQFIGPKVSGATDFQVQSPNGFRANDRVIAVNPNDPAGTNCELTTATAVGLPDANGVVTISHPAVAGAYASGSPPDGSTLLNLGQVGEAVRTLYDIANGQLRSTDLFAAAPANPIAQNVVLMKAQYGIDCQNNGIVFWTSATASNVCGRGDSYTEDEMVKDPNIAGSNDKKFGATGATIARIRAIRIGIVVRSDEPDLKDAALKGQTAVLFNCSTNNAACQGRTVLDNTVLTDYYRFRTYETVVPMRNAIWNTGT